MKFDILSALIEAAYACPSLRLGQLISNAAKAGGWELEDVFYCPDTQLRDGLKKLSDNERKGVK